MVIVRKRKNRSGFQVDIRGMLPSGERYRERVKPPVTTASAALRWGQQREAAIIAQGGVRKDKPKEVPTLAEFWPTFIEGHVKANRNKHSTLVTREGVYKTWLAPRWDGLRLDAITSERIQQLKGEARHLSAKRLNNILNTVSVLLKKAVEWGKLEAMPCTVTLLPVDDQRPPEFWEPEQYEELVRSSALIGEEAHLLTLLGGDAGLRLGEIVALEWTDVALGRRRLPVQRSDWQGHVTAPKGGRSRCLPLTRRLTAALKGIRHLRSPHVLCLPDGSPMRRDHVIKAIRGAERTAGLTQAGIHILRHTFCSHLAMKGAPARAIQELAGHAASRRRSGTCI
jgi:integrase